MDTEETWALHLAQCQPKVMDQSASEFKVEVSGIKEVSAKTSSSIDPEPPVKKEKLAQPKNLPDGRSLSEEVVVEEAVRAESSPSPTHDDLQNPCDGHGEGASPRLLC